MHDMTITVFNLHNGVWYPSVISGVTLFETESETPSTQAGHENADSVELHIMATSAQAVMTTAGSKLYFRPKSYARLHDPDGFITFDPAQDFFWVGALDDLTPIPDEEGGDSGFYSAFNEHRDGVYRISSALWLGLIPHFEIGGR